MKRVTIDGIEFEIPDDTTAHDVVQDPDVRNQTGVSDDSILIAKHEAENEVLSANDPVADRNLFTLPRYQSA